MFSKSGVWISKIIYLNCAVCLLPTEDMDLFLINATELTSRRPSEYVKISARGL